MEPEKGTLLFEEKLLPVYLPGGRLTYRKELLYAYAMRGAVLLMIFLAYIEVIAQFQDHVFTSVAYFCEALEVIGASLVFFVGEYFFYIGGGLSSRPLRVYANGLDIPPPYHRKLIRNGSFLSKEMIDRISIKRYRRFGIAFSRPDGIAWLDAPVEFVVHLKNGRKRRSGQRPPETIREAVEVMSKHWNVAVIDIGSGNGERVMVKGGKIVERVKL